MKCPVCRLESKNKNQCDHCKFEFEYFLDADMDIKHTEYKKKITKFRENYLLKINNNNGIIWTRQRSKNQSKKQLKNKDIKTYYLKKIQEELLKYENTYDFNITKPIKDEFEKSTDFENRVELYNKKLLKYHNDFALKRYNVFKNNLSKIDSNLLNSCLVIPKISNMKYKADNCYFDAILEIGNEKFEIRILVPIINEAKFLKENQSQINIKIIYKRNINILNCLATFVNIKDKTYEVNFINNDFSYQILTLYNDDSILKLFTDDKILAKFDFFDDIINFIDSKNILYKDCQKNIASLSRYNLDLVWNVFLINNKYIKEFSNKLFTLTKNINDINNIIYDDLVNESKIKDELLSKINETTKEEYCRYRNIDNILVLQQQLKKILIALIEKDIVLKNPINRLKYFVLSKINEL